MGVEKIIKKFMQEVKLWSGIPMDEESGADDSRSNDNDEIREMLADIEGWEIMDDEVFKTGHWRKIELWLWTQHLS